MEPRSSYTNQGERKERLMPFINNSIHFASLSYLIYGPRSCLKQNNNSAIDVPEFGSIDPSGLSAQSGNYIKIPFLPIFLPFISKKKKNNK